MGNTDIDMEQHNSNIADTERDEEVTDHSLLSLPRLVMHGTDFIPQTLSCLAATSIVIHSGAQLAFSAVLLPELMTPESVFKIDEDEASWIASIVTISTPVGSLLSGPLMDKFGRKSVCKMTCLPLVLSWIIIAFARNVYDLYCGRLLAGFGADTDYLCYEVETEDICNDVLQDTHLPYLALRPGTESFSQ